VGEAYDQLALDLPINNDSITELSSLIKGMDIDDNGTINYTGNHEINYPFQNL
jgi:hypothetical protein